MGSETLISFVGTFFIVFLCILFCCIRCIKRRRRLTAYKNRQAQLQQQQNVPQPANMPSIIVHINRPNVAGPVAVSGQAPNAVQAFSQPAPPASRPTSNSVIVPAPVASAPPAPDNFYPVGWQLNTISREISNSESNAPPPSYSEVVGQSYKS